MTCDFCSNYGYTSKLNSKGVLENYCVDCISTRKSSDINWKAQNQLMKQWHIDNPDAKYGGWVSI